MRTTKGHAVSLSSHCAMLHIHYGSYRAAGEALGIDHAYLHRLATSEKEEPSDEVLAKMGLRAERSVRYVTTGTVP